MSVKVTVTANYARWIKGFGRLEEEISEEGERMWSAAGEVFFSESQTNVHVLSGDLKKSGSMNVTSEPGELTCVVEYDEDYAIHEENRGGSHAYIGRAWETTEAMFREAMPETWEGVVSSWK